MTGERARFVVLVVLATIGGSLLAIIVGTFWLWPNDNFAYWIAGQRLQAGQAIYAPPDVAFEPYAYHYPPPVAQLLAPLTLVVGPVLYLVIYRSALLLALWDLTGRRMLQMLASLVFIPIAIGLRIENVDLFMASAIVYGVQRWPWLFALGTLIKVSPGLGLVYLACRRRWRDVAISSALGVAITIVSVALAPDLWLAWLDAITGRADIIGNSLIPVPYSVRAVAGLALAVAGGLLGRRRGELLLVVAMTIANPGLAVNGFAVLAAAVPVWFAGPEGLGARWEPRSEQAARS